MGLVVNLKDYSSIARKKAEAVVKQAADKQAKADAESARKLSLRILRVIEYQCLLLRKSQMKKKPRKQKRQGKGHRRKLMLIKN
jgi:hypothetical protein